jgi:hypothetical protein
VPPYLETGSLTSGWQLREAGLDRTCKEHIVNKIMKRTLQQRLAILSDAAKYDASCASSGGQRRDSRSGGLGSAGGSGICHAYAPDGRCISLLKILLTNFCIYDCAYCINRSSSNVERARFTPQEVVWLTLEFYRRNDGADGARGARPAHGSQFQRLHSPQDDPRGVAGAYRGGGALCRPAFHQYRAADGNRNG